MISPDEFFEGIDKVQYYSDEPHANLSSVALYFLARLAREHVKVVLSGEGADELFAGYNDYKVPFGRQDNYGRENMGFDLTCSHT